MGKGRGVSQALQRTVVYLSEALFLYNGNGKRITEFPSGEELRKATPVYEYMKGWNCDISGCRTMAEMPEAVVKYVKYIEEQVGCPIQYVSVGAEREEYIKVF